MPQQTSRPSALSELRLDTWVPRRQDSRLLGSLADVLSEFAGTRRPTVPAQRTAPESRSRD